MSISKSPDQRLRMYVSDFSTADFWEFKILDSVWIFQLILQGQSWGSLTQHLSQLRFLGRFALMEILVDFHAVSRLGEKPDFSTSAILTFWAG